MAKGLGKSHKGRQHVAHTKKYSRQWSRTAKHKQASWTRHLAKHPNDVIAKGNIAKAKPKLRAF